MIDLVILTSSFKREIICFKNDLLGSFSVVPNFVLFTLLSENEIKNVSNFNFSKKVKQFVLLKQN